MKIVIKSAIQSGACTRKTIRYENSFWIFKKSLILKRKNSVLINNKACSRANERNGMTQILASVQHGSSSPAHSTSSFFFENVGTHEVEMHQELENWRVYARCDILIVQRRHFDLWAPISPTWRVDFANSRCFAGGWNLKKEKARFAMSTLFLFYKHTVPWFRVGGISQK